MFQTSDNCVACHNGLTTSSGENVSIGTDWRASMMANSSRDPYWQAGVRREMTDHPAAAEEIQDECSICHMPMSRTQAHAAGRKGEVFAHLPVGRRGAPEDRLAHDGVSCTVCHQITSQKLGTPESFTGGFVVLPSETRERSIFGPYQVDQGRTTIMRSATGFRPVEASHLRESELCATCHTLITQALGPKGEAIGTLPEQVPYQEWLHSAFRTERSCQSCHMPVVDEDIAVSSVLGDPRKGMARHTFVGGNFFMLGLFNRYRAELGVDALPQELDAAVRRTVQHLESQTAALAVDRAQLSGGRLAFDVAIRNLGGHKLPTGYPSRRVWLHVVVRDRNNRPVFESGAIAPNGAIEGNDNDTDPRRYEPHYAQIRRTDEVQIYESMMVDSRGAMTTGLLTAVRFIKDNRLLPRGFDKRTAKPDIAVIGEAAGDADFDGGQDRVRYDVDLGSSEGPFGIDVELRFQPISFRWAENLKPYDSAEPRRFVRYYASMSASSSAVLARVSHTTR
jgi:hypothetical protein